MSQSTPKVSTRRPLPKVDGDCWGLLSDIHGNLPALERGLRVLERAGVRKLAFLGDYLGRGDSDGCARLIRQVADLAIVGNRDLDWQMRVAPETRDWVLGLPRMACAGRLLLAHGDARLTPRLSTTEVSRGFGRGWLEMEAAGAEVFAFGHSHHARCWRKSSREADLEPLVGEVRIDSGARYLLNVGTTGLPFPGKGGPSVAVLDFGRGAIRHLSLESDLD